MNEHKNKFSPQEIEDLEERLTKKIDDLKNEFYNYKEETEGKMEEFMNEQRKFAKEIGKEVVEAFKTDFNDKYIPMAVYEEGKRADTMHGRYKFMMGCMAGVLTVVIVLTIIASTLEP